MLIRTATIEDLDAVTTVEAECFPPSEAATRADFEHRLSHYGDHFWLMFEEGKLISFVGVFVTDEAWLFKAKKRAYTLFPNVRSLILFRSYRSQPSMAICFFFSTVGFASFFGTKSFRMPCLNSALISSCSTFSPT